MFLPEVVLRPVTETDVGTLLCWAPDKLDGYRFPCGQSEMLRLIREWNAGGQPKRARCISLGDAARINGRQFADENALLS